MDHGAIIFGMRTLLLILFLLFQVHGAWGIDKIKSYWCKKKAAKAKTELAAGKIYSGCYSGKKLRYSCGKKAAKAKTVLAANRIYSGCYFGNKRQYSCGKKAAKTDNVAVAGVLYRACYNAD